MQHQGGPCAVIAPVQAFLLKTLLSESDNEIFSDVSETYGGAFDAAFIQFFFL